MTPSEECVRLTEMLSHVIGQRQGRSRQHIGVDVVNISEWERWMEIGGQPLLDRVFTSSELVFARGRPDRLATRFAAKEATLKVLGTGNRSGITFRDVEVQTAPEGRPSIVLHRRAASRAKRLGLDGVGISLCHETDRAYAIAVGYSLPPAEDVAA